MQECEGNVTRFLDTSHGDKTKAAVKRFFLGSVFFKHVIKGPEGHHVDQTVALANVVGERSAHICRIACVQFPEGWDVPFGPEQGKIWPVGQCDLCVDFLDGPACSLIDRDIFVCVEQVFDDVIGIAMRADEIDWDIRLFNMGQESIYPIGGGRCWSTNAELGTD